MRIPNHDVLHYMFIMLGLEIRGIVCDVQFGKFPLILTYEFFSFRSLLMIMMAVHRMQCCLNLHEFKILDLMYYRPCCGSYIQW